MLVFALLVLPILPSKAGAITLDDVEYYQKEQVQEQAERFKAEQEELSRQLMAKAQASVGKRGGQCVVFIKKQLGVTEPWGLARNVKTNTTTPVVGAIIKTNESWAGHIGQVISFDSATVTLWESNYKPNVITIRTLPRDSKKILGYKIN